MVHTRLGITDATVTLAPKRARVSVIQVVSISSLPSAMGTRTRLVDMFALRMDEDRNVERLGVTKACDLPTSAKATRLGRDKKMRAIR
jgi:hypothetical protein